MKKIELNQSLLKAMFQQEAKAIEHLAHQNDADNLLQAAQLLADCPMVIISGLGKSGFVAAKFAATLTSVGRKSIFLHPVEALHGDIGIVEQSSVAVLFSKSGSTSELITLIPHLRKRQCIIISVLGNSQSPIAELSDIVLSAGIEKEICPLNLAPTTSILAAMAITNVLTALVVNQTGTVPDQFAASHPAGQLGRNLLVKVKDIMHTNDKIPRVNPKANLGQIIIEMSSKSLGCTIVENEMGLMQGLITDGDVRRALGKSLDMALCDAQSIMTILPVKTYPEALVGEALSLMEDREKQISVLPVLDDSGHCIGIIRIHDIVRLEQNH
jgi:arabinose-5-phosphate isomerase